jgi:hypothetical protein
MSIAEPTTDRASQILDATATMLQAHKAWQASDDPGFGNEIIDAISAAVSVVLHGGDMPAECVPMLQPYVHFGEAWLDVLEGRGAGDDGIPVKAFWSTFESVAKAHATVKAAQLRPKQLEAVADLLDQFGDDGRRWEWVATVYAIQQADGSYEGPFFDASGEVQISLIKQEAAEPGSVVPDSSVLTAAAQRQQSAAASQLRLNQLRNKYAAMSDEEPEDPATIEQLLRMEQYPDVIARSKNVSLDEVFTEAARLGIIPRNREADLLADTTTATDKAYEAASEGISGDVPGDVEADTVVHVKPTVVELTPIAGDELSEKILTMAADDTGLDAVSAIRQLGEAGYTSSLDDVAAALAEFKDN